ncbi:MAG: enoyl-CoA hydratase/isomerase family protein [Deltaproteobacteria bacterium]|nr:enoyl-CoA hydratase/isomerase family protein [Deltaproteobacteria bacterium]MBW1948959.1 enoyl-CoA hydratase/isomerase family protein [Deltaproteobacteria bacterium]
MSNEPVLYEEKGHVAQIKLNRPENRNSMDEETMKAFGQALERVRASRNLRCLVVTGSGSTFCAGADFKSSLLDRKEGLPHEFLFQVYSPFLAVHDLPIPTIAAMNGHAIGGGFGLALVCDIRVANRAARYGANFARLGLHTGMGTSYLLPRLVGFSLASELLFTGRLVDGETALRMGLVNYAEEEPRVLERAWEIAREIAICAPVAVRMIKRSIARGLAWDLRSAAEMEAHCQSRTFEMEDAKEGVAALLEKRAPVFRGK